MLTPGRLSFYGRYSYRRQLPAEMLLAVGAETALLGQFVLARIFHPDPRDITLLFALLHASFFLSPWIVEQMRGRSSRRFYGIMLLLGPGALLLGAFVRGFWGLGPLLIAANLAFVALFVPLRNRLLRSNYDDLERGACYGSFKMFGSIGYFGVALAAALALERSPDRIYWMLPVAGLVSAAGIVGLRSIRPRGEARRIVHDAQRPRRSFAGVYADLARLFAKERAFRFYQAGFLLYGFGFMFSVPREIDAVASSLQLSYTQIVIGIYGVMPAVRILVVRRFGRLLDRAGPWVTAAVSWAILAAYPVLVWGAIITESFWVWLLARAVFGLAMAGVDIAWSIGPVTFGGPERATTFSSAHIFAVGLRASIVPFIGSLLAIWLGHGVFLVAAAILVVAAVAMRHWGRRTAALAAAGDERDASPHASADGNRSDHAHSGTPLDRRSDDSIR